MADWVTVSSSLATAAGTLVLAVATFSSVRSANRSARVAELSLLSGIRPVLIPSREEDPDQRVGFGDDKVLSVHGHGAAIELDGDLYMAMGLRNGGNGLAVLHGWRTFVPRGTSDGNERPDVEDFRRQQRDLYIPAGDTGFWQGRLRDPGEAPFADVARAVADGRRVVIDLLYGDFEGGQRTIARFGVRPDESGQLRVEVVRYWNVDRQDPR